MKAIEKQPLVELDSSYLHIQDYDLPLSSQLDIELPILIKKGSSLREDEKIKQQIENFPSIAALLPPISQHLQERPLEVQSLQLTQMGFKSEEVHQVLQRLGIIDLTEIIQYLIKDANDLFLHTYIQNANSQICSMCGQLDSRHQNVSVPRNYQSTQIDQRKRNQVQEILQNQASQPQSRPNQEENKYNLLCQICYKELEEAQIIKFRCNHTFCNNCIKSYLTDLISQSKVEKFSCPTLNCNLELGNIENLVDQYTFKKQQKFKRNIWVNKNPDAR